LYRFQYVLAFILLRRPAAGHGIGNLAYLAKILAYNKNRNLLFFRISTDLVALASHTACTFIWQMCFSGEFQQIGEYIRKHGFRISVHPDQSILLYAPDEGVLRHSIAGLVCQVRVHDLRGIDNSAKVQIPVRGIYSNKTASIDRFVETV
jgi:UV DNA damage endonuclease